mgnify:CR=1 FL=1
MRWLSFSILMLTFDFVLSHKVSFRSTRNPKAQTEMKLEMLSNLLRKTATYIEQRSSCCTDHTYTCCTEHINTHMGGRSLAPNDPSESLVVDTATNKDEEGPLLTTTTIEDRSQDESGEYATSSTIIAQSCIAHKCERLPDSRACSQRGSDVKPYEKFCSVCCGGDRCDSAIAMIASGSNPALEFKCAAADPTSDYFDDAA